MSTKPEDIREFDSIILNSLPTDEHIVGRIISRFKGRDKSNLSSGIRELLLRFCVEGVVLSQASALIKDWNQFYNKYFGLNLNFSAINIPDTKRGFDRLILIPKGLTIEMVLSAFYGKNVGIFRNMKVIEVQNSTSIYDIERMGVRKSDKSYALWVRDCEWSDTAHRGLSPEMSLSLNIPGITLLERLVYHLKYFDETGEHLDIDTQTFCTGSVYVDQEGKKIVPTVSYQEFCPARMVRTNKLVIFPFLVSMQDHRLRVREVVCV